MEDTVLNFLFVVVVSFLVSNDHLVFRESENDIAALRKHEHFLQREREKLDLGDVTSLDSQSPGEQWDTSDAPKATPNFRTTNVEEQITLVGNQKTFGPDNQASMDVSLSSGQSLQRVSSGQSLETKAFENNIKSEINQIENQHGKRAQMASTDQNPTSNLSATLKVPEKPDYSWYFWRTLSLISIIRVLRKLWRKDSKRAMTPREVSHLDYKTLSHFANQIALVQSSSQYPTRMFVEGLVHALLETMRNQNSAEAELVIGDFVGFGSLYELYTTRKNVVCDLHVVLEPAKPFVLEFHDSSSCCRIKMVKATSENICPCRSSNPDGDMLCLLHHESDGDHKREEHTHRLLCGDNGQYLAKSQVTKWFHSAISRTWDEISHRYEFVLRFCHQDILKVQFRSGHVIQFKVLPVVQYNDHAHLVPQFLSPDSDTIWPVSFQQYENALLEWFTRKLPENSCHIQCLQILSFAHQHQMVLTGPCGLTNQHLKNTLLLLLSSKIMSWNPDQMSARLQDLLGFLRQSIRDRDLPHALIGNTLILRTIEFPEEFRDGKPVNLFLHLLNKEMHLKTKRHLAEMIKNMPLLIQEYGGVKNRK